MWPDGVSVNFEPICFQVIILGKLFTPVLLSPSNIPNCVYTGQRAVMLYGREGNRRSGVALAVRHRLKLSIYYLPTVLSP